MKSSPVLAPRGFTIGLIALCLLSVAISAPAAADDPKVIGKITELNKKALDSYTEGDFAKARTLLKQALDMCASSGLDHHPIAARTHIHMGVVMVGGLNQHDLALKQFQKAIEIEPQIQVTKNVATPEVEAAFREAASGAAGGGGDDDGGKSSAEAGDNGGVDGEGDEKPKPSVAPETGIIHMPVKKAKTGAPILITAKMGTNVTGFDKVVLGFKGADDEDFTTKNMTKAGGGRFASQIPSTATNGRSVAYYIEAQDAEGTVLASVGGESKPLSIALGAGKKCPEGEDDCDDDAGGGAAGSPIFVALMGGWGFGYTTGHADLTTVNKVDAGIAPSSAFHVAPEFGYFINPDLRLSLQARIQIVAGPTPLDLNGVHQPAKFGVAALARASWFFGSGKFRPYVSVALGGGQIRHVVVFQKADKICGTNGGKTCIDSVTAGPLLFGGGFGFTYGLSDSLGLVVEANPLIGLPKFTFHVDLNGGLALRF